MQKLLKKNPLRCNFNQFRQKNPFCTQQQNPGGNSRNKLPAYAYFFLAFPIYIGHQFYNHYNDNLMNLDDLKYKIEQNLVKKIEIQKIIFNDHKAYNQAIIIQDDLKQKYFLKLRITLGNVDHFLEMLEQIQFQNSVGSKQFIPIVFTQKLEWKRKFVQYLQLGENYVFLIFIYFLFKRLRQMGGGSDMFQMGKTNMKTFGVENKIETKFADVAGQDQAKQEIMEFVDFLKNPDKFKQIGARSPRGALLSGPPGTGKTLLAKACAGEAGVPFFYISGSDFVEMFVGVGASRVRDLFKKAKKASPSIIFIDEIDAVGKKRESGFGGNDERDQTLNQLLVEMDGFGTDASVILMGATNQPETLDPALLRPGRFDRQIQVTLPDLDGRKDILKVHLKPIKFEQDRNLDELASRLATLTPGFSGADIANLCNEAAIFAARENKKFVESIDFEKAQERIMAGIEKTNLLSIDERKTVAYHESGHAVISWFLEGGSPLLKVFNSQQLTIIPRSKGSLGFAQYLPNENALQTQEELMDMICVILGGRCAEYHFFKQVTTGAQDDLQKAYKIAENIVTKYGMSQKIGNIGLNEGEYSRKYRLIIKYSEYFQEQIDNEIQSIINQATARTKNLIQKYEDQIQKQIQNQSLSKELIEKETLDLKQIISILGQRPFPPKQNFKAYLETKKQMDDDNTQKQESKN